MKSAAQIILICALLAATGVVYYVTRSNRSSEEAVRLYFSQGVSIAPTLCSFMTGEFDVTLKGKMYLSGKEMRADFAQAVRGTIDHVHVIRDSSGDAFAWSEERRDFDLNDVALDFTSAPFECSVWWGPDDSIFDAPLNVSSRLR